ncbi:MAG: fasciclin domain-containing protein, partial [Armatimonadetes bacterium]|nr:fasciclin domain-containing protein [Armatimonadota bacterium]
MTGLIAVLATIALPGVLLAQTSTNREIQGVQTKSVYDTLAATGKHKTLLALIDRAGLKERISPTLIEDKTSELVTVFAPTDDAFAKVPKNIMDKLNSDPKLLEQVLLYHIASGKLGVSNLT